MQFEVTRLVGPHPGQQRREGLRFVGRELWCPFQPRQALVQILQQAQGVVADQAVALLLRRGD